MCTQVLVIRDKAAWAATHTRFDDDEQVGANTTEPSETIQMGELDQQPVHAASSAPDHRVSGSGRGGKPTAMQRDGQLQSNATWSFAQPAHHCFFPLPPGCPKDGCFSWQPTQVCGMPTPGWALAAEKRDGAVLRKSKLQGAYPISIFKDLEPSTMKHG